MKNLSMILALCAFIATPAFADETAAPYTKEAPAATAPAKTGKMKTHKGKRGAKKAKKAVPAAPAVDAPKAE